MIPETKQPTIQRFRESMPKDMTFDARGKFFTSEEFTTNSTIQTG